MSIESPRTESLTEGALDILVFADGDRTRTVIGGEAKEHAAKLHALIRGMRKCAGRGMPGPGHISSDHKKCLGLLAFRPPLFLGVAGGYRQLHGVSYADGGFELSEAGIELAAPQGRFG